MCSTCRLGGSKVVRLRLQRETLRQCVCGFRQNVSPLASQTPTSSTIASRHASLSEDEKRVHRQALAGMLWSKQYYYFDLDRWLTEHDSHPLDG